MYLKHFGHLDLLPALATHSFIEPNLSNIEWARKPSQSTHRNLKRKRVDTAFERDFWDQLSLSEGPEHQHSNPKRSRAGSGSPPRKYPKFSYSKSDKRSCDPPSIHPYRRKMPGVQRFVLPLESQPRSLSSNLSAVPSNILLCSKPRTNPTCSLISPIVIQKFFNQRINWRASGFVEWSSLPPLTLKYSMENSLSGG